MLVELLNVFNFKAFNQFPIVLELNHIHLFFR